MMSPAAAAVQGSLLESSPDSTPDYRYDCEPSQHVTNRGIPTLAFFLSLSTMTERPRVS